MDGTTCQESRTTLKQLQGHQIRTHGYTHLGRALALDNQCGACGKVLNDELCLKSHLMEAVEKGACPRLDKWCDFCSGLRKLKEADHYLYQVCEVLCPNRLAYAKHMRAHLRQHRHSVIATRVSMRIPTRSRKRSSKPTLAERLG